MFIVHVFILVLMLIVQCSCWFLCPLDYVHVGLHANCSMLMFVYVHCSMLMLVYVQCSCWSSCSLLNFHVGLSVSFGLYVQCSMLIVHDGLHMFIVNFWSCCLFFNVHKFLDKNTQFFQQNS